jgi:hypothetical protein
MKSLFLGRRINAYVIGLPWRRARNCGRVVGATWSGEIHLDPGKAGRQMIWWDNRCEMHRRRRLDTRTAA